MAVAQYSKYLKQNLIIGIVICVAGTIYCTYDGYINQEFIAKHTIDGVANSTLAFNMYSPPFLVLFGVLLIVRYCIVKNYKIVAGEEDVVVDGKRTIKYSDIESLNKTYYDAKGKGYFTITYKDEGAKERDLTVTKKRYDGTDDVLHAIVSKIS